MLNMEGRILESNVKKMAEALITGYRKLDYDGIYVGWESSFNLMAEAMGCRLIKKGDNLPSVEKPIISEPKDLERVKVADPVTASLPKAAVIAIPVTSTNA